MWPPEQARSGNLIVFIFLPFWGEFGGILGVGSFIVTGHVYFFFL